MDNKNKKRFIVIAALSMALCFTIGMTDSNAYVVRKNNAKISLTAGQSKKIKLAKSALKTVKNRKKSIKVKSANKKIVKIKRTKAQKRSYSFTIKALKKGKTTVIVKSNKKNIKIKVTVRDAADKNVVITDTNVITSTPPSVTAQPVVQTEAPNTPDPTIRPLRTRISVPASEPETRDGYTKLTDLTTYSINGDYLVNIWTDSESQYYYNVVCEGLEVVEISSLGLMLDNTDLTKGLTCDNEGSYVDEIYEEFETITLAAATSVNNCQERTIRFSNVDGAYFDLLIRVYNDGFAYRYTNVTYGEDEELVCTDDSSAIVFPEGTTTWGGLAWINTCENGFEYICLDVGWRSFEDRLGELCDYADSKGVKIFCWVNYRELTTPEDIEKLFSKWAEAGAVGVKTDYFEGEEQQVLNSMENIAVIGAKYHFMVLYHGCISPGGESRTYPNVLTTEAVLGEENRKWSNNPSSKNCLMFPFTRNILGSMDYTPACMNITNNNDETEGFALAKSAVYESGLLHLAAPAEEYRDYVGLYFLTEGKKYTAYIYSSDDNGSLVESTQRVSHDDVFTLSLKDLDGVAVYITEDFY